MVWTTLLVAALLAAVAIGTYAWQAEAWKLQKRSELAPYESDFYQRRHRRRLQISGLLAIVAVAMAAGLLISDELVVGLYWLGVLMVLLWIILLASADAFASHGFFARQRSRSLSDQAALHRAALERRGPDSDLS